MTGTEAVMWAVEKDPALRSDFVNLTVCDRPPDRERLLARVREAIVAMPRLGQRVVAAPLRLVPPEWVDDPSLDLDHHVRHQALPAPGGKRELLDLVAALAEAPFDRSRPLWQFTVVDGLADGRAALVQKMHHTITDGVGGLRLSLSLVDLEREPGAQDGPAAADRAPHPDDPVDRHSPLDVLRGAVSDAARGQATLAQRGLALAGHLLVHPTEVPGRAGEAVRVVSSLRRQLLPVDRGHSRLLRDRSLRRHVEVFEFPLPAVRSTAARLGGTVNDVFVAGVVDALVRYHERMGEAVDELRMTMPVNVRGRGEVGGNRFAPVILTVPVDPAAPAARFAALRDRLHAYREEASLGAADALAGAAARLPTSLLVAVTRSQTRAIDFAASNLRGSPVPLYLAGARILANYPIGPRAGAALNVTVLSYCDVMYASCNIDPAAITDVPTFMGCVDEAFSALLTNA